MKTRIVASAIIIVLLAVASIKASANPWGRHYRGYYRPAVRVYVPPVRVYAPAVRVCPPPVVAYGYARPYYGRPYYGGYNQGYYGRGHYGRHYCR